MSKTNRGLPLEHLEAEYRAMRWLAANGYTLEEIQKFSWADVDEFDKKARAKREVFFIKYDRETGQIIADKREKELLIPIDDREVAEFFAHSRVYCHWCFVSERPLSWRKEKSLASLFPLCKIEEICGKPKPVEKSFISSLTQGQGFGTIKVSKVNIQNTKTKEQAMEAALVN